MCVGVGSEASRGESALGFGTGVRVAEESGAMVGAHGVEMVKAVGEMAEVAVEALEWRHERMSLCC